MKKFIITFCISFVLILILVHIKTVAEYYYVENKFAPVTPIGTVYNTTTYDLDTRIDLVVHKVNTPRKAKAKSKDYNAFEIDIISTPEGLFVAHDDRQIKDKVKIGDIFAQVQDPTYHSFWIDMKTELTPQDVEEIASEAKKYGIPNKNLFFELGFDVGEKTAPLLWEKKMPIILRVIPNFENDNGDPARREELNKEMQQAVEDFKPYAIMASAGKYTQLKAYFPDINKAIHYPSQKLPNAKKYFVVRRLLKDPKVELILMEEYLYLYL